MRIKYFFNLIIVLSLTLLTGCTESSQLHRKLIVQGIGIDTEDMSYKVTIQAFDFQNPVGEKEPSVKVIELYGDSVMSALSRISMQTGLEPLYSQNLLLALGEDAAYKGADRIVDFFIRHYESRPNVKICVVKGKASDMLKHEVDGKPFGVKNMYDLIKDSQNSDVMHFVSKMRNEFSDPYAATLNLTKIVGEQVILNDGLAVFSEGNLKGFLTEEEAIGALLVNGVPDIGTCVINIGEYGKATCRIDGVKTNINVYEKENILRFDVNTKLESGVFEIEKPQDIDLPSNIREIMQEKLAEKLVQYSQQAIAKSMLLDSDIFDFGKLLVNSHRNYIKDRGVTWRKIMKESIYNVYVDPKITVTGTEIT